MPAWGCGPTPSSPGFTRKGPKWSRNTHGPTEWRCRSGNARRTVNVPTGASCEATTRSTARRDAPGSRSSLVHAVAARAEGDQHQHRAHDRDVLHERVHLVLHLRGVD